MHEDYLKSTAFIDSDSPEIRAFAQKSVNGAATPREKAVKLYYAVRDGILYDPYRIEHTREGFKASNILSKGYGYCVAKAIVMAAVLRAQGIPCKLHFADVRNHLTTKRLKALMQTDTFYYHGYNDIRLDGRWIKVTPTFNLSLCEKLKVKPLDWDGASDAVFHPFDLEGRRHMEYVTDHGSFADVPYETILNTFYTCYGDAAKNKLNELGQAGDFEREAQAESIKRQTKAIAMNERIRQVIEHPLHRHLGITDARSRDGQGCFTFVVGDTTINPAGALHGGVVYLLCDVCAYLGLLSVLPDHQEAVTHDIHVSVLRGAARGDVVKMESRILKKGRNLCFIEVTASAAGQLITAARITKSLMKMRDPHDAKS